MDLPRSLRLGRDPLRAAEARLDGRNVDPALGTLSGEGAAQRARDPAAHPAAPVAEDGAGPSYYGLPVLKEPVWKWMIPAYFFTGGLAGACAVLGAAAQLGPTDRGTRELVRRCRLVAAGGAAASAALLIADLGRPARFLHMLRVFRPTSPMNMGTWILSGFGAFSGVAALPALLPGRLARVGGAAALGAGALGLPLVGYTGVLLAGTAVPVWQQTRSSLPVLFAFSGAVSAGALFDLWPVSGRGGEVTRRFGLLARGSELMTSYTMDAEASRMPRVARPLHHGRSGALLRAARALIAASLAAELLGGRTRRRRALSGGLAMAGTLALRFGILAAGRASARDPHATFELQRAGGGAAEIGVQRKGERPGMPTLPGIEPTGKESTVHGASP